MKWYAQAGQDQWVYDLIGHVGFFVDVGAHDGVVHSNTYALELMGWTGLCVEPDPEPFAALCANRTAAVTEFAATATTEDVVIWPAGIRRPGRTLDWMLDTHQAPPVIDYLSIDVEGHEVEVLAGLDFDRWHVRVATIEHNLYLHGPALKREIDVVMEARGFVCAVEDVVAPGHGPYENWWINARK